MLDIAFSELLVIGVVALVVIGPEKLPKVARTAGILLGRAQRYVGDIKSDINRQIQFEELKALQAQMAEQARTLENTMQKEMLETEAALTRSADSLKSSVAQIGQDIDAAGKSIAADAEQAVPPLAETTIAPLEAPVEAPDELYRGEPPFTPPQPTAPTPRA
ncbi:MAG: twin-arginine translocase subunit TatB [Sterolibacterium sp.]|jgi:sec-independent protein translocase protein TatB|nr:twin-arginine translocase subunit TatB [Sterolibacterium sp.]